MGTIKLDDSLLTQFKRPTGEQGRAIAVRMNKEHDLLTSWGLSHVKIQPDFVILDVGCGGGKTIGKLGNLAFQGTIFGIDYSKDMVDFSKKENHPFVSEGRINLLQGSVNQLSFPNDFFDLVTAIETYYFWPNLPKAFHEIKRVLGQSGKLLIISEMIKDGKYEVEHAEIISKTNIKLCSLQELQCMLEDQGFRVKILRKPGSVWNCIVAQK